MASVGRGRMCVLVVHPRRDHRVRCCRGRRVQAKHRNGWRLRTLSRQRLEQQVQYPVDYLRSMTWHYIKCDNILMPMVLVQHGMLTK